MGKVVDKSELVELRKESREKGLRIVFTNGCFDILHIGHVHYLTQARKLVSSSLLALIATSPCEN